MPERVLASATVDQLRGGPVPLWSVHVWAEPPHTQTRTYDIERKTDGEAAQEGIRLFVEEVEAMGYADHQAAS